LDTQASENTSETGKKSRTPRAPRTPKGDGPVPPPSGAPRGAASSTPRQWTGAKFSQEPPRTVLVPGAAGKPKKPKAPKTKQKKNPAAPYPGTLKLTASRQGETEQAVAYVLDAQSAVAGGPVHATFKGRDLQTVEVGGNRSALNDEQRAALRSSHAREVTQSHAASLQPIGLAVQAGTKDAPAYRYTPEGYCAMLAQMWADTQIAG
jgi:hypothetical protein